MSPYHTELPHTTKPSEQQTTDNYKCYLNVKDLMR